MSIVGGPDDVVLRGLVSAVEIDIIGDVDQDALQIDLAGDGTANIDITLPGVGGAGPVGPTGPTGPAGPGGGGSGGTGAVAVQDENVTVVATATSLDFRGDGVTVSPGVTGEAVISVSGTPGGVASYTHYQTSPAATWTINHPLTFQPNVTVVDSFKREVWPGEIEYLTPSVIRIFFSASIGGEAYLS